MAFGFSIPQDIRVGSGVIEQVGEVADKIGGKKGFIISGPHLKKMGHVDHVRKSLSAAGIASADFTDIEGNPSVETVDRCTKAFLESGADFIVAFGGGSPMDVAKAVGVTAKYGGSITEYEGGGKVPGPIVPIIAIPTTAGTGSEVTAFSVITDHARNYKLSVFSYALFPKVALLDPDLLATTPVSVASACGIDAFIHAEESYVSRAANPFTEAMSEKAMALIGANLRRFTACREDREAATAMLEGSLFAGIAFSFARLGNVHAMSHPVSAFFDVAHGVANGVLLPAVVEYNALADHGKYYTIYETISPRKVCERDFTPDMLAPAIRELCRDIGIPETLREAVNLVRAKKGESPLLRAVISDKFDAMADDAMKSGNIAVNPRTSSKRDILDLYNKVLGD